MATKQELQQSIEKMVKVANNPKTAESTRSTLLKAIEKAEKQLKDLEKAETLEKKEEELTEKQEKKVEEVKKESKKAVAEAKQKIKVATSKLSKKVGRPSAKPSKLMNKAKKLALKYRLGQKGVPTGDFDIERDAGRPALPKGKRIAKKSGKTYYENRENRIDRKQPPKRYPKLEKGGLTGDVHALTDDLMAQKIEIFLKKVQPYKYYFIDENTNTLIVGFDKEHKQDEADKFMKEATSSMEFFDADSVDMQFHPETGDTKYTIKLKKDVKFASGGKMEYGGILQPMTGGVNADPRFDIYDTGAFMRDGGEVAISNSKIVGKTISIQLPTELKPFKDKVVEEYKDFVVGKKGVWSKKYINSKNAMRFEDGGMNQGGDNEYLIMYRSDNPVYQNEDGFEGNPPDSMFADSPFEILEYLKESMPDDVELVSIEEASEMSMMKKGGYAKKEYGGILQPMTGGVNADPRFDIYDTGAFMKQGGMMAMGGSLQDELAEKEKEIESLRKSIDLDYSDNEVGDNTKRKWTKLFDLQDEKNVILNRLKFGSKKMAMGGATEHGLMEDDLILVVNGNMLGIKNQKSGERVIVDISKGTRQKSRYDEGGEIRWQDVQRGDSALVKAENKLGVIVKTYGRKFHLKFVDGTEKTYDANDLKFIGSDDDYKHGGETDNGNLEMLKNQAKEFKHHAEELHDVLKKEPNVEAWVVAKSERATTDLSDITHYLDGQISEKSDMMANGGKVSLEKMYEDFRKQSMMVRSKIAMIIGIDEATEYLDKDLVVNPFSLIESAVRKGFITMDEINQNLWDSAVSESESIEATYRDSGEGIGSSDMNAFISSMLNDAGIKVGVKDNTYQRMADGGDTPKKIIFKRGDYFVVLKDMGNLKRFRIWKIDGNNVTINYSKYDGTDVYDSNETKTNLKYLLENGHIKKVNKKEYWNKKYENYAQGGKVKFADKVASIKKSLLERKKVPKAVQKDYGKTFSPAEAEDSAKRIVGSQTYAERIKYLANKRKK
jgi:hypothetical protein